jgi:tetratricopeptide (TPR) repeat protein
MALVTLRISNRLRLAASITGIVSLLSSLLPAPAFAAGQDEEIYMKWEEVVALRAKGRFDDAVAILEGIIEERHDNEQIQRRAYNHLVFIFDIQDMKEQADEKAREALERYPDILGDPIEFGDRVNKIYDRLREEMFGSIRIATKPEACQVSLDGVPRAELTPLGIPLVRVGKHDLIVKKPGYLDHSQAILVEPNAKHTFEVPMKRKRRTIAGLPATAVVTALLVVVTTIVAILARGGGDEVSAPGALPGPPPPPDR